MTKRLALLFFAWAGWAGAACDGGPQPPAGASGDAGANPSDHTASAPTSDASVWDAASDAPWSSNIDEVSDAPPDAPGCGPLQGPARTFDQEVAFLGTPQGLENFTFYCGTVECDGLLAILDHHGADAWDLYLFDATTRDLVEKLSGNNGLLWCTGTATGVDLTANPAFNACQPDFASYGTSGGFLFGDCAPDDGSAE